MLKQNSLLKNNLLLGMLFLLSILLNACGGKGNLNTGKYKPNVNPSPKYFFNVKGYVAPELRKYIDIKWQIIYVGSDKKCDAMTDGIEGVSAPHFVIINYHPVPDKRGSYTLHIPLDKYLPGYCKWTAFEIDNNLGYGDLSSVTRFTPCGNTAACNNTVHIGKYKLNAISNIDCQIKKDKSVSCREVKGTSILNDNMLTPKDHTYHYFEKFNYIK